MSLSFDDTWKAYHQVIDGQDVYVYSHSAPIYYLLDGFSRPSGIPHHIEKVADILESDEDTLPFFDNPIDADPNTSGSKPARHRGPAALSTASIEHYMQQITASLVSMDSHVTAMGGHLTEI